jgi:hypothetical protein
MVSTLDDLHMWAVALGTGQLLKPDVWQQAHADRLHQADMIDRVRVGPAGVISVYAPVGAATRAAAGSEPSA